MKTILLNPPKFHNKTLSIDPILTRCAGIPAKAPYLWPPIGLAYLTGFLRENYDVNMLDAQAENLDMERLVKKCQGYDLIVLNTGTPTIERDKTICKVLKEKTNAKITLIGNHATYFSRDLIKNDTIDFVVKGEPEKPLFNLIDSLSNSRNLKSVKGLVWKNMGKIISNRDETCINDLNRLPFAARDLLPNNKYYDILTKKKPFTFMITSRGCPYDCTFCSAKTFNGTKYRYRDAGDVIEEVREVVEMGFKDLYFFDDTFTIHKQRVLDICHGIKPMDISWRCLTRVDTVDREMLKTMKRSGCYQIQFGVESGSQKILDKMKKNMTVKQVKKAFKWCDELGIETVGFFIFGYPGETRETINKTLSLVKEIKPDFVTFNLFTPLPGSEIFERIKIKHEWDKYDLSSASFCDFSTEELLRVVRHAYKAYYMSLQYPVNRLLKTRSVSDVVRFFSQNIQFWLKRSGTLWDFLSD
jgi:radical SAM superfamily enzyme YgiQ (UPF0313 family)